MTEHRSHHRSEPEPPRRTVKDYAWIGVAITTLATMMGGHAYDRNSNLNDSENMHRSTLRYNAEERSSLDFRLGVLERQHFDLHREFHHLRRAVLSGEGMSEGAGAGMSMDEVPPPRMPEPRYPRGMSLPRRVDSYEKLMKHVGEGKVYQPKGYGH